jgi:hypothetical protein
MSRIGGGRGCWFVGWEKKIVSKEEKDINDSLVGKSLAS